MDRRRQRCGVGGVADDEVARLVRATAAAFSGRRCRVRPGVAAPARARRRRRRRSQPEGAAAIEVRRRPIGFSDPKYARASDSLIATTGGAPSTSRRSKAVRRRPACPPCGSSRGPPTRSSARAACARPVPAQAEGDAGAEAARGQPVDDRRGLDAGQRLTVRQRDRRTRRARGRQDTAPAAPRAWW